MTSFSRFVRRPTLSLSWVWICWVMMASFHNLWAQKPSTPFDESMPNLDSLAVGEWWTKSAKGQNAPPSMNVPRDQVIAFALYTHEGGVLKLTAQLFPLQADESDIVRLEIKKADAWFQIATTTIVYPGWSAHFRITDWDNRLDVPYRVRHGDKAIFEGVIRRDPIHKEEIVVASMSCNSSRTTGLRSEIVDRLRALDPDLLFFAGDQTYRHTEHTAGWIEFGLQFRDVIKDRPTVTIPDDHDVGHPNLWGENGKKSTLSGNADGGYFYPVSYVNMVQRQQTWHLPDPVDAQPIERGISVYFTRLHVGGIDFAILEDRKFKTGPAGRIPKQGPRPDHITNESYDPKSIDLPGLELLGARQMRFLKDWGQTWDGAQMKVVLSQTAFCGAVHMHGKVNERLLADLDCNGWPQTERNKALAELRRCQAIHLCGDQHLAVVVQHGIDTFGDGPFGFTSPALVNTIYGRWWHPKNELAGPNPVKDSPLPWTGDFLDGLGNRISMKAYANPANVQNERQRADGFGIIRFHKKRDTIRMECWPRFAMDGVDAQFPGWPVEIQRTQNDGRVPKKWLPEVELQPQERVVQVVNESTGEILYTRLAGPGRFRPPVFGPGRFKVLVGVDRPQREPYPPVSIE